MPCPKAGQSCSRAGWLGAGLGCPPPADKRAIELEQEGYVFFKSFAPFHAPEGKLVGFFPIIFFISIPWLMGFVAKDKSCSALFTQL